MDSDLLIKCFIAFCIVAIVCNLIYSSKLCNKDLVEGQDGICNGSGSGSGSNASCSNFTTSASCTGACTWTASAHPPYTPYNKAINDINENIFNKSIQHNISYVLKKTSGAIDPNLMPKSIDAVTNFDQFGDNEDALNFLEMIVQKIIGMDDSVFKTFMYQLGGVGTQESYCQKDINEYIISIILLQYNKINKEKKDSYINISNRLSRYIPDILEKIQNVNITCGGDISARSNIMDVMFYRLFKNNNTIINIGSLDKLVKELKHLPKVYGVVILLCITFIIVKIFGMFNMKLEV